MALIERQVEIALHRLPIADGTISIQDSGHVLWAFTKPEDLSISVSECSDTEDVYGHQLK